MFTGKHPVFFFFYSVEPRCDKVVLFSPLTEGRGRGEGKKKERNKHHCEVFMMIKKRKTNKQPSSPLYLQIRPCQKQRPHFIILKKKKKKRQEKKKKRTHRQEVLRCAALVERCRIQHDNCTCSPGWFFPSLFLPLPPFLSARGETTGSLL